MWSSGALARAGRDEGQAGYGESDEQGGAGDHNFKDSEPELAEMRATVAQTVGEAACAAAMIKVCAGPTAYPIEAKANGELTRRAWGIRLWVPCLELPW